MWIIYAVNRVQSTAYMIHIWGLCNFYVESYSAKGRHGTRTDNYQTDSMKTAVEFFLTSLKNVGWTIHVEYVSYTEFSDSLDDSMLLLVGFKAENSSETTVK